MAQTILAAGWHHAGLPDTRALPPAGSMAQTAERFGFDLASPGVQHDVFDGTIPPFGPRDSYRRDHASADRGPPRLPVEHHLLDDAQPLTRPLPGRPS